MNIHRKDKARLKQSAATATSSNPNSEAQLSLNQSVDIPRLPSSLFYTSNINIPSSQALKTSQPLLSTETKIDNLEKGKFSTWPCSRQVDIHALYFEGQFPASNDQESVTRFPFPDDEEKGDDHPAIHGQPGSADVDVELRLGPERPQGFITIKG